MITLCHLYRWKSSEYCVINSQRNSRDIKRQFLTWAESHSWARCRKLVPGYLHNVEELHSSYRDKVAILGVRGEHASSLGVDISPFLRDRMHTHGRRQPSVHESMNTRALSILPAEWQEVTRKWRWVMSLPFLHGRKHSFPDSWLHLPYQRTCIEFRKHPSSWCGRPICLHSAGGKGKMR